MDSHRSTIEYKFQPIKFGIKDYDCSPGFYFTIILKNNFNRFYGIELCFDIQTKNKTFFLLLIPFGQIRFNK